MENDEWTCFFCAATGVHFSTVSLDYLLAHIRSPHAEYPYFNVACGFNGCARYYTSFKSLSRHIKEFHNHQFLIRNAPHEPYLYPSAPGMLQNAITYIRGRGNVAENDQVLPQIGESDDEDNYQNGEMHPLENQPGELQPEHQADNEENYQNGEIQPLENQLGEQNEHQALNLGDRHANNDVINNQLSKCASASMFLARVQHKSCLPQSTVDIIKDETCTLLQNALMRQQVKIAEILDGHCDPALHNRIAESFQDEMDPFEEVNTSYRQQKYFESFFPIVVSIILCILALFLIIYVQYYEILIKKKVSDSFET